MVAVLASGSVGSIFAVRAVYLNPGPLPAARAVVVPHGGSTAVAEALAGAGVIKQALPFRVAVWLTRLDGPLHASELEFPAHVSLRSVLAVLRTGHPVEHLVTIPEGLTAREIVALLERAEALNGSVSPPPEGSVRPQTYAYEYGTTRTALLARMEAAMAQEVSTAWAGRAPGLPLASAAEAVTLASIVERETAKPEERPHVAAVYLKRLRLGMKLQADPTVIYAASSGLGVLDHKLTRAELDRVDPYNTYRVAGLPPGPICAPGLASLVAVLHPLASDDLYFVADGTGGHVFAQTEAAHNRNVAAWRALTGLSSGHGSPD